MQVRGGISPSPSFSLYMNLPDLAYLSCTQAKSLIHYINETEKSQVLCEISCLLTGYTQSSVVNAYVRERNENGLQKTILFLKNIALNIM